jgi:hypothetical protein
MSECGKEKWGVYVNTYTQTHTYTPIRTHVHTRTQRTQMNNA